MAWFSNESERGSASGSKLQLLTNELEKAGLKHQMRTIGPLKLIEAGFSGDNTTVKIRIVSAENDSEFKILSEDFARIPQSKLDAGYRLVNKLNRTYKHVKFTIDDDGDVSVQWDLPDSVPDEAVGKTGIEIMLRMFQIIDSAYPEIMKAIWS